MSNRLHIAIPVSASDEHLLEQFVNSFIASGGAPQHPVVFYPTPMAQFAATEASKAIAPFCESVDVVVMPKDFKNGWPQGCNEHFHYTITSLGKNTLPWLWLELDTAFLVKGWADALIEEYILTGNRGFMGVILPTRKIKTDAFGKKFEFQDKGDLYMAGVAVYPPDASKLMDGMHRHFLIETGFDVKWRNYTRRAWRKTDLITTRSGTCLYTRGEDGKLVAQDLPNKPPFTENAGSIPLGSVIHHGCKDDSLVKLLLAEWGVGYRTIEAILSGAPSEPSHAPEARPPADANQDVEAPSIIVHCEPVADPPRSGNDERLAEELKNRMSHAGIEPLPPKSPPAAPTLASFKSAVLMEPPGKSKRIEYYAKKLNTSVPVLRKLVTPDSGLAIASPSGWVRVT